ncbi:hypothetical protein CJF42_03265 [Pseudoalteromonas sp. NBT06-2]|uniref:5-oxoprolinase subunit C family protein n=1 Tax=Pseudoalteromonas sp. NBT06-2 TaxID=2025950 RepID=UPI000BA5B9DF|nr:biotin-dependent carboxyltransferase family protein [Pseudoalteromonas sp. NBT06-2]PAJ75787.1 hypothetical protein CJF42_03265 [Pseudoalteromonas sp. NBT06-2]
MSLYFIKSGLQTSVQDCGRSGQMHNGISNSGAMDPIAMKLSNWLLSKPLDSAVIEVTLVGPKIQFENDMYIAITGAKFELYLNNQLIFNNKAIQIFTGDVLTFGTLQCGARAYIATSIDIDVAKLFNSYSTHLTVNFGGFYGRSLKKGDILALHLPKQKCLYTNTLPKYVDNGYSGSYILRCTSSVETDLFTQRQQNDFSSKKYTVTANSNRMGIRLKEVAMGFEKPIDITSSGLMQGSIQITPSGLPIISSVDGQTIGGYPRIANVITADLAMLGQLKANDKVNFMLISNEKAIEVLKEQYQILNFLYK